MRLFSVLKQHAPRGLLIASVVFGVLSGAASTGLLWVINEYLFSWGSTTRGQAIMGFVVLLLVASLTRFFSSYTLAALGARAAYDLRVRLAERILGAPLRRLEELGSHRLMVSLTDDVNAVTDAMAIVPMFFINLAVVGGGLIYLGWLSWQVLLMVILFMVVGSLTYVLPLRAGIKRQELAREVEDDMFDTYRGLTQGTKELKMRRQRRFDFLDVLKGAAGSFRDLQLAAQRIFIAAATWGNLLFFAAIGLVLFYLPIFLGSLDVRIMASYVVVLIYILTPLQTVLNDFPMLTEADVAVRKIERLGISLLRHGEPEISEEETAVDPGWQNLELRGVSHAYRHESDDSEFTLGPLDLTFTPGEWVFVVGGNGSGKTTFAKLVLGLYPPEEGEVRLDGQLVDDDARVRYRQIFSPVFTDFFLFESLLGLGSPDLDEKARQYLEELHLKHKVRIQDGRLSTVDLSQGQRKRLALLNAYLEDSPIFLFDEWAADQDPEFKEIFYRRMLPSLKERGKLLLVISHDDRYYHLGDRVLKFDFGQLVYDRPVAETEYAAAGAGTAPTA
jgi:putative ATP-binding cassette transporter